MPAPGAKISIRKLFALLVAVSLLFSPAAASAAMAAGPDHMRIMDSGHCQMQPGSADHDKAAKNCCAAMCMALAVAPSTAVEPSPPRQQMPQFPASRSYHGLPGEIATPPPRSA